MANNIPAGLRSADIGRFAVRAAQLESVKPVVAYWCNFFIVNQIIERGLHTSDDEIKLYTTNLVDKLEKFKSENPDNDTVTDAVAASAYVEQFGMEVFGRAEATMRANKVTRQTADTFQAAATFLELLQIWHPPEPEVAAKIKFAKYHALRIAKAIKAGEDPNATNPVVREPEDELKPADNDPEVQAVMQTASQEAARSRQPSVEDVTDEPMQPSESLPHDHPQVPSVPTREPSQGPDENATTDQDEPLTLPSAPATITSSSTSVPRLPDTPADIGVPHPHPSDDSKPADSFQSFPPPATLPSQSPVMPPQDVRDFYNQPSVPPSPAPAPAQSPSGSAPMMPPPARPHVPAAAPHVAPAAPSASQMNPQSIDDQGIALAQKHARWAVSALAFDDVNTAIKELRNSLRYLGAE
ncbi:DUF605-domain-containing protein [Aspergillus ambiguus]|uniref:uncharacterized protein n=1 Tax=Aspergillus ambiguus TaxID=176160 RepID=UPI003CCE5101